MEKNLQHLNEKRVFKRPIQHSDPFKITSDISTHKDVKFNQIEWPGFREASYTFDEVAKILETHFANSDNLDDCGQASKRSGENYS